jgi:PEP-CTERM motif-containing protein
MKRLLCTFIFVVLAAISARTSDAQVIYNTRGAFDLAHPINYVIDFNNFGPDGTFYPSGLTASTPVGNVSFLGIPQTNFSTEILSASHFGIGTLLDGNFVLSASQGQFLTDSLLITLPANTFSFGTDIISPSSTVAEPYQFTVFSGSTVLAVVPSPSVYGSYTFIGFDSLTSPITSITVQIANALGNGEPVLDNFTVVPEPSTWFGALAAAGAVLVIGRRRIRA